MPFIPYYPGDNDGTPLLVGERENYYFRHTLEALQHWNNHENTGHTGRPAVPEALSENIASRNVKHFFDHEYVPESRPRSENFDEAAKLLRHIIDTAGVKGVYSFFRILSSQQQPRGNAPADVERFRKVVSEVFVPHFSSFPTEEVVHGLATLGHIAISPLVSIAHAPVAAYSVMRMRKLRKERLERKDNPPLEIVEQMLPLLQSMHAIAQHSADIIDAMQPSQVDPFPPLPPIDMKMLHNALERVKHGDDLLDDDRPAGHARR